MESEIIVLETLMMNDIITKLAFVLPARDLLKCLCVCKKWNIIMQKEREKRLYIPKTISIYSAGIRKIICWKCENQIFYDTWISNKYSIDLRYSACTKCVNNFYSNTITWVD